MLMNIGQEDIEMALAFFSCFTKRLVTLFSALWYIRICRDVNRSQIIVRHFLIVSK